jgi:hypothetical protein
MVAAAVTFRESLEVWLVVGVVLSFVGLHARQHVRPLLVAIVANFLLGAAIGAGASLFDASLETTARAISQGSMIGVGALLMVSAVFTRPACARLARRLVARPGGSRVSVAPVVYSTLFPVTILAAVLRYGCALGSADLFERVIGTAMAWPAGYSVRVRSCCSGGRTGRGGAGWSR